LTRRGRAAVRVGVEQQFELGWIERFAFGAEDAAAEGVDGLLEESDLGAKTGIFV
jgi:hypothetical protein